MKRLHVGYTTSFIRQFKSLTPEMKEAAHEAIEAFEDPKNHARLKVHKLKGHLRGSHAFSIDYRLRIVFDYSEPGTAVLHTIGDHDIYQ